MCVGSMQFSNSQSGPSTCFVCSAEGVLKPYLYHVFECLATPFAAFGASKRPGHASEVPQTKHASPVNCARAQSTNFDNQKLTADATL